MKATDVSPEAISYCKAAFPEHISNFQTLDCLKDHHPFSYTFIYSVAVIHMLVPSKNRTDFYQFIYQHLTENGLSLICTMGDGKIERETDIRNAFRVEEREHSSGSIPVSSTSCKMVSFSTFEKELKENHFTIIEKGLTESFPDFSDPDVCPREKIVYLSRDCSDIFLSIPVFFDFFSPDIPSCFKYKKRHLLLQISSLFSISSLFHIPSKSHTVNYFSKLFSLHPILLSPLGYASTD